MGKREQNKEERRQRILAAAKNIIYDDSFSMRKLAEHAGVSVVTAYAIFGSRQNIVASVFEGDLEEFQQELEGQATDTIDRMFAVLAVSAERFRSQPDYFRSMLKTVASGDSTLTELFMLPRMGTWRHLMADAVAEGHILPSTDIDALAKAVIHFTIGLFQDWGRKKICVDHMRAEGNYVLSILLTPVSTPSLAKRLRALTVSLHDELSEFKKETGEDSPQ